MFKWQYLYATCKKCNALEILWYNLITTSLSHHLNFLPFELYHDCCASELEVVIDIGRNVIWWILQGLCINWIFGFYKNICLFPCSHFVWNKISSFCSNGLHKCCQKTTSWGHFTLNKITNTWWMMNSTIIHHQN